MAKARAPAPPLRILLVGAGHFGRQHLIEWQALEAAGQARLVGVVVHSAASRDALAGTLGVPVHLEISDALLREVDAVDIAAPTAVHAELVRRCLPCTHVLVEKPLAPSRDEARALQRLARRHGHVLMTVHQFRHHPVMHALVEAVARHGPPPSLRIVMTNPQAEARPGLDPFEEFVHVFDQLHALWPQPPRAVDAWRDGPVAQASLALQGGVQAQLRFGWTGPERVRRVELSYPDLKVGADFADGLLTLNRRGLVAKQGHGRTPVALGRQLAAFCATVRGGGEPVPSPEAVDATLALMEGSRQRALTRAPSAAGPGRRSVRDRPRVAVIGGGVFGSTCAIELAPVCDVILCERHDRLLTEASFLNQWRHHSGFHYPRSIETIQEVQAAKADFEGEYERAIRREITAYYAVSSLGSEISRERYLAVCRSNGLRFEEVPPPPDILRADRVSVCLKTDEAVVDIDRLTALLMQRLKRSKHIDLRLGTQVQSGRLLADGRKRLGLRTATGAQTVDVDYVVNATYAHTNLLAGWFGFPVRPMRFDLLEMAIFRIPKAARFMMTILDAPFTSLTHTGTKDLFMLSHIHQSILASEVTANGLPPSWRGALASNQQNLLAHGLRYLPLLQRATYVESRVGVRTVEAYNEDFDGRPTVVTAHGFGCWSVLGGKIITAVSNSHEIRRAIERESGLAARATGA